MEELSLELEICQSNSVWMNLLNCIRERSAVTSVRLFMLLELLAHAYNINYYMPLCPFSPDTTLSAVAGSAVAAAAALSPPGDAEQFWPDQSAQVQCWASAAHE